MTKKVKKETLSEEELKKLAEAMEESKLEEEIEEAEQEKIDPEKLKTLSEESKFVESPVTVESPSPSLEKIQEAPVTNLEQFAASQSLEKGPEEPEDKKSGFYSLKEEEKEEKKYHEISQDYREPQGDRTQRDENLVVSGKVERIDMMTVGKDFDTTPKTSAPVHSEIEKLTSQDPNYLASTKTLEESKELPFGHERRHEKPYEVK